MVSISNSVFLCELSSRGFIERLVMKGDPEGMNWVLDASYLHQAGYPDEDKLFGHFGVRVDGEDYTSSAFPAPALLRSGENRVDAVYGFGRFQVKIGYDLSGDEGSLTWNIALRNTGKGPLTVEDFGIWASVAYVMFKDPDVRRNMEQSCAVFPSVSKHFSKLACVRRSNRGPHLGLYAVEGETRSVGTFCRFENLFFHDVSPSLDGILYHRLVLVGDGLTGSSGSAAAASSDWIYGGEGEPVTIGEGASLTWAYRILPFASREEFYELAGRLGHPVWDVPPVAVKGGSFEAAVRLPEGQGPSALWLEEAEEGRVVRRELYGATEADGTFRFRLEAGKPGEKKLSLQTGGGRTDSVVFNVTEPIREVIEARADFICRELCAGPDAETPHAFLPISNQGESLGKAVFVLMKNAIGTRDARQIRKVEDGAVLYVRPKWFTEGDFRRPTPLYGHFYRIFDLDYVAHVFYLLSRFGGGELVRHAPEEYLRWAAEVMIVRLDPALHKEEREREETEMLGVYILFIEELLRDLERSPELREAYDRLSALWRTTGERLRAESDSYRGAVTEHYFDNAGFGPTFEALCRSGHPQEATRYGELLLANIGFSNDFRAQNPDRWWEALSYMIHSLWGGLSAASALVGYETLRDPEYLLAAYRSTMAVFYCYDWNATATRLKLRKGEAASTYSVAGPHLNRPDLSRNRFGQSTFTERDGEIFKGLFQGDSGYDWDMGEELAAYLAGFGTKTFLYRADGEIRCVNGEIFSEGGRYRVTSYAAYPREYHFYEENASYVCGEGEEAGVVYYADGKFERE
ncbi:hypothetical protein [Cohnella candidum]|uniref:hypothetical protein n=1 Tax=Cohnella candidum TaxID=2674991 RepID=UPI0013DDB4FF|nr:hypothetical protein [Cohnella candidum]